MSPTAPPSLKKAAVAKVSVIIYISSEFRNEYNRLRECKAKKPFQTTRSKVLEKFTNIIPNTLRADVHFCLERIHKDVLDFARECCMRIDSLNGFCWRSNGDLNRYETVKRLFKNPKLFDRLHLLILHMLASNRLKQFLS